MDSPVITKASPADLKAEARAGVTLRIDRLLWERAKIKRATLHTRSIHPQPMTRSMPWLADAGGFGHCPRGEMGELPIYEFSKLE